MYRQGEYSIARNEFMIPKVVMSSISLSVDIGVSGTGVLFACVIITVSPYWNGNTPGFLFPGFGAVSCP